jgi:acyl dehydratase
MGAIYEKGKHCEQAKDTPLNAPEAKISEFAVPITERYFEDYIPGSVFEYGTIAVTESEIIEFAKRYDPQTIHTDPEAAAHGAFGGLISSGWQTAGWMMRLFADNFLSKVAGIASPGVDELRWILPVRPGDSLRIRISILDARRSRSKPDRGLVTTLTEVLNQNREVVMSVKAMSLLRARETAS